MNTDMIITDEQRQKLISAFDVYLYIYLKQEHPALAVLLSSLWSGIGHEELHTYVVGWFDTYVRFPCDFNDCAPVLLARNFFEGDPPFAWSRSDFGKEYWEQHNAYEKSGICFRELVARQTENASHNMLLGLALLYGVGVRQNERNGFSLILSEAEKGHSTAKQILFFLYRAGLGTERNYSEALRWLRSFAEDRRLQYEREKTPKSAHLYANALYLDVEMTCGMLRVSQAKATLEALRLLCDAETVPSSVKASKWRRYLYHDAAVSFAEIKNDGARIRREQASMDEICRTIPLAEDYSEIYLSHCLKELALSLALLADGYRALGMKKSAEKHDAKSADYKEKAENEDPTERRRAKLFLQYWCELYQSDTESSTANLSDEADPSAGI